MKKIKSGSFFSSPFLHPEKEGGRLEFLAGVVPEGGSTVSWHKGASLGGSVSQELDGSVYVVGLLVLNVVGLSVLYFVD